MLNGSGAALLLAAADDDDEGEEDALGDEVPDEPDGALLAGGADELLGCAGAAAELDGWSRSGGVGGAESAPEGPDGPLGRISECDRLRPSTGARSAEARSEEGGRGGMGPPEGGAGLGLGPAPAAAGAGAEEEAGTLLLPALPSSSLPWSGSGSPTHTMP